MHTKPKSNSSSPVKDPVAALKRNKQGDTIMSSTKSESEPEQQEISTSSTECFWNVTKASNHPVVLAKINRMRRKNTDSKLYRELMYEIGTFLAYEATSDLTLNDSNMV